MKILLFIIILTVANPLTALAINPASEEDYNRIQKQIFEANKMDKEVRAAELRLTLAKNSKQPEAAIAVLEKEVEREWAKQSAARTKAIHATIEAYGLDAAKQSGKSVMPMTKGREITWLPVARVNQARQIQDAGGKLNPVNQDRNGYVAITYQDGVSVFLPEAFEAGPGYLASLILHERIHYEQFTANGKGNKMSYAELQIEAYKAQVDNASIFFNDPEDKNLKAIKTLLAAEVMKTEGEAAARKGIKGLIRQFLPPPGPPDVFEAKVHSDAELSDISALVAKARAQADISRRDREERAANVLAAAVEETKRQERQMEDIYRDIHNGPTMQPFRSSLSPEELARKFAELKSPGRSPAATVVAQGPQPFARILRALRDFSATACREQSVEDRLHFYNAYDLSDWAGDDEAARSLAGGLDTCSRQLFYSIIERTRANKGMIAVDGRWTVNTMAANAQLLNRSQLPGASTGTGGSYSGGRGGGQEAAPPTTPPHDPEKEALRQLKGIEEDNAMRKRWGLPPKRQ